MSQATIDILRQHRLDQITLSPSSELFQIFGGGTFSGIFDRAHLENPKDRGNVTQKKLTPVIMVPTIPDELIERSSVIIREDGITQFTFFFAGLDDEGVPLIWLQ